MRSGMIADRMDEAVVEAALTDRRRFEARGRSEEFLPGPVGVNGVAILTRPAMIARDTGFVLCRSPGPEQGPLQRLEAMLARGLAEQGFPSIRMRRGFRDEGTGSDVDLGESLAEVEDAARELGSATGVTRIGVVGALLGAASALLTADRLALPLAVLVCPAVSGSLYLDELYRRHLIGVLARPTGGVQPRGTLEEQLRRGPIAIRGMRLTPQAYAGIAPIDLFTVAKGFAGSALVVGVTPTGAPDDTLPTLAASLGDQSRVAVHVLDGGSARDLAEATTRKTRRAGTQDVRLELDHRIVQVALEWAAAEDA
jgi:hypothetical protein